MSAVAVAACSRDGELAIVALQEAVKNSRQSDTISVDCDARSSNHHKVHNGPWWLDRVSEDQEQEVKQQDATFWREPFG